MKVSHHSVEEILAHLLDISLVRHLVFNQIILFGLEKEFLLLFLLFKSLILLHLVQRIFVLDNHEFNLLCLLSDVKTALLLLTLKGLIMLLELDLVLALVLLELFVLIKLKFPVGI